MMAKGWLSIILSLASLAPSFVPGAMSIIGLLLSFVALAISVTTVKTSGMKFYKPTLAIVLIGVFLVNDGLRLWNPLDLGGYVKPILYTLLFVVIMSCSYIALRLVRDGK